MILRQKAGASRSSQRDITGIRSEAVHRITFQMDHDNAVVVLKQYRESNEVNITMDCMLMLMILFLERKYRKMVADIKSLMGTILFLRILELNLHECNRSGKIF